MRTNYFAPYLLISMVILGLNLIGLDFAQAFVCSEGGFSISMPGEPILEQVNHKSFVGNVKEYSYKFENETEKYTSSYTELPGVAFDFMSNDALLNKAKKGLLKANGGRQVSYKNIAVAGNRGTELTFQLPPENNGSETGGKARFYIVGKTMYVLVMVSIRGDDGEALIDRFLNSFRLLSIPRLGSIAPHTGSIHENSSDRAYS